MTPTKLFILSSLYMHLGGPHIHARILFADFSELSLTCTGSPQGCVLSPLLYTLYRDDCRSNHLNRFLLKFADDSALLSVLQGSEQYHGPALTEFVNWCDNCYLDLNVTKTKEKLLILGGRNTVLGRPLSTITKLKLSVNTNTLAASLTTS